jgi:hypothetical protein
MHRTTLVGYITDTIWSLAFLSPGTCAEFDTDEVPDLASELSIRTIPAFFSSRTAKRPIPLPAST